MIRLIAPAALLAMGVPALAQHADLLLARDAANGGKLVTGEFDFDNSTGSIGKRVYEGELEGPEAFVGALNGSTGDEPGFNSIAQTAHDSNGTGAFALPGNTAYSFTLKSFEIGSSASNLWFWNGVGGPSFSPVSDGTLFRVRRTGFLPAIANGLDVDVDGFDIITTGTNGFSHQHRNFDIVIPDDVNTLATEYPLEGYYAVSMVLNMTGVATSDPIYIVFGVGAHGSEDAHEAAIEFFETTVIPEPTSVALIGLLGAAFLRRRTR